MEEYARKPLLGNHKLENIANMCKALCVLWEQTPLEFNHPLTQMALKELHKTTGELINKEAKWLRQSIDT